MSIVWIENLTINERPRSTKICAQCGKACVEAIPRARLSYLVPSTGLPDHAQLHIACVAPFASNLLKGHASLYKQRLQEREA